MTPAQTTKLELFARKSGRGLDDVTEIWNERAAIREYEGGFKRRVAESSALDDTADIVLRPGPR